ncbi:MAG: cobalamin-independent methionine synthase II family protein [Deltaproteobacteria bacterium]|nr:cobalamin-independent methionine synthase II family protein [Deltaproteobacteria bacterium]
MLASSDEILTTHAGSLPRPPELLDLLVRLSRREVVDDVALAAAVERATRDVVAKQLAAGIHVGNDGEQPRESFVSYVQHRMSGFGGAGQRPVMRDITRYPSFLQLKLPDFGRTMVSLMNTPQAIGPVTYTERRHVEEECALLARATADQPRGFRECFMTAASPGIVASAMLNASYPTYGEYVTAVADALATEYQAIVAHGYVLQIDAPDLAMERHTSYADRPLADFLRFVDTNVTALNRALRDIPEERVRLHVCWGNYEAPHDDDVPLAEILPLLYAANVGALVVSLANPRHAHEWRCFRDYPLPAEMLLIAGVVDPTTNYVEHPEVVADRIERAVEAVGDPRRVLATPDCGFATAAGLGEVAEEVVWLKLRALVEGARLASQRLFA